MDIAINRINAGSYIPLELNGTTLHVGSLPVDLDAERKDVTVVIDLYLSENGVTREKTDWFAANISLPPIEYSDPIYGNDGENNHVEIIPAERQPLALNQVSVTLWALPEGTTFFDYNQE